MSSDSPDRFEPSAQQKAKQGKSASKRIAIFVFIGAGIIFTLVAMSILNSGGGVNGSNAPVNLFEASRGAQSISIPRPKPPEPEPAPVAPPPAPKPQTVRPAYIPVPRISDIRKKNQEQRLLAANAPTNIQAFRDQTNNGGSNQGGNNNSDTLAEVSRLLSNAPANPASAADMSMPFMPQQSNNRSDPNGWERKDAFTKQDLPEEYSKFTVASPRSPFELKSGTLLPCVLISGLNSDLPGNMIAQVSENVWDTATGRYLLIPRGSRIIGTYDNQISYGQSRVLVMWSRLIFPDGSSLVLDNLKARISRVIRASKVRLIVIGGRLFPLLCSFRCSVLAWNWPLLLITAIETLMTHVLFSLKMPRLLSLKPSLKLSSVKLTVSQQSRLSPDTDS